MLLEKCRNKLKDGGEVIGKFQRKKYDVKV